MSIKTFTKENFPAIITGIVSFAAVFVSIAQVWVASIDKDKELKLSNLNSTEQRKLDETKAARTWKLDIAGFMAAHRVEIYSKNEDGVQLKQIMLATFPPEITSSVFGNLSKISSNEDDQWLKAQNQAKKLEYPQAKIFYDKNFPPEIFDAIPDSIGEGDIGYLYIDQIIPDDLTKGDIRYFRLEDKALAEQTRDDFKRLGCLTGYKINLTLIPLTKDNIQNPGNFIEVWLSSKTIQKLKREDKC